MGILPRSHPVQPKRRGVSYQQGSRSFISSLTNLESRKTFGTGKLSTKSLWVRPSSTRILMCDCRPQRSHTHFMASLAQPFVRKSCRSLASSRVFLRDYSSEWMQLMLRKDKDLRIKQIALGLAVATAKVQHNRETSEPEVAKAHQRSSKP